jgi:signal transduction histidine kinase
MKSNKLEALIFRHYTRSALLSILTIEVLLLALYFGVNAYIGQQTEGTLKHEVRAVMPTLVAQSASAIGNGFQNIAKQTAYFAQENEALFAHPDAFPLIGEKPTFERAPNGSLYQTNLTDGSSLFISATGKTGEREMLLAEKSAALNPLYRHLVHDTPNVVAAYINTPGDMNRLYPFMQKVWEQYPPDLNMEDYNFFYLADAKHNPSRQPAWTGVYLDPAGQGWMLSCVAPVYQGDTLEGVVGLDVTVEKIVEGILNMNLPWKASAFLADDSGMILAMSEKVENLLGLRELKSHVYSQAISKEQLKPEEFNLFKMADPGLVAGFQDIYKSKAPLEEIQAPGGKVFVAQGLIPETGWRLFVVIRQADVFESLNRLARLSRFIGYGVLAGMLVFYVAFFFFLRDRAQRMAEAIADPVETLTLATATLGKESSKQKIPPSGIEEIDQLTTNFNSMADELDRRSAELVEARVRTEMKQKESELAYTRGLYESASGYLHNVGNAITRMESHVLDLETVAKSARQYPEVFRKLEEGGSAASETLQRFKGVLLEKTTPLIAATVEGITQIKDSIKQAIAHQQASFRATHRQIPDTFSLSELLADVCAQSDPASLSLAIAPGVELRSYREPLRQGLENLVKNAHEAIPPTGKIRVTCRALPDGAEVLVEDDGCGIAPEKMPLIMSAGFTTKPTGNGLGLHSFAVFLSAADGRLTVESDGLGKGTRVKAIISNVSESPSSKPASAA